MSESGPVDFETRRRLLAAQIDLQRHELSTAFHGLAKPLHYAETGMKGLNLLRENRWLIQMAPGLFAVVPALLGFFRRKSPPAPAPARLPRKGQRIEEEVEEMPVRAKRPIRRVLGWAYNAFQLYRRVRPYFL